GDLDRGTAARDDQLLDEIAPPLHLGGDVGVGRRAVERGDRYAKTAADRGGELPIAVVGAEDDPRLAAVAKAVDVLQADMLDRPAGRPVRVEGGDDLLHEGIVDGGAGEVVPDAGENSGTLFRRLLGEG